MALTAEQQFERACGFLILNDFDAFIYCCKCCLCEFHLSSDLEEHILSEHQNTKMGVENVFVTDGILDSISMGPTTGIDIDDIKQEIDVEPTVLQEDEVNPTVAGVFIDSQDGNRMSQNEIEQTEVNELMEERPIVQSTTSSKRRVNIAAKTAEETTRVAKTTTAAKKTTAKTTTAKTMQGTTTEKTMTAGKTTTAKTTMAKTTTTAKTTSAKTTTKADITKKTAPWLTKYYCDMCPFDTVNFIRKDDLAKHLKEHFTVYTNCTICNETVESQGLSKHIRMRHPEKAGTRYICNFCERNCKTLRNLTMHLRIHTGERPYLCATCGSAFKTNSTLRTHTQRLHTNRKMRYSCEQCDLQFLLVSQFEAHRLTKHSDSRPHVCEVCQQRFKATKTLNNHRFTHKERSFACRYCGKMFKTSDVKRYHERKVHEEVDWRK